MRPVGRVGDVKFHLDDEKEEEEERERSASRLVKMGWSGKNVRRFSMLFDSTEGFRLESFNVCALAVIALVFSVAIGLDFSSSIYASLCLVRLDLSQIHYH